MSANNECIKCKVKPGYHNFEQIGRCGNSVLYYTAVAKTEDFNEDGTKLANITIHVDEIKTPWIWVFDCNNMEIKHYTEMSFNIGLVSLLSNNEHLTEVWIFRPNFWIQTTIAVLRTLSNYTVLNKFKYFDGNNLELYNSLLENGASSQIVHWLIAQ